MGRLEFGTPRDAWGGEAVAFTPLLAQPDLLDYLGRETGIGPLTPVETEHPTAGNRSLDILAETADGKRVAIENQYHAADHDHLTRGLAYAVATNASALVVIAEEHRGEFVAVADYLNEVGAGSESGIRVWLIKVRAVRRKGDSIWSPEFVVQAEPNEWVQTVADGIRFGSLEDFYQSCAKQTDSVWAGTARAIIGEWLARPGANEAHNNKTCTSLFYPSPRNLGRGTNVLQLHTDGVVDVCRYYIWQTSGVFDDAADPTDLDEQIRACFPTAHWPPKRSFIRDHEATPAQVRSFTDWVVAKFDAAMVPEGA